MQVPISNLSSNESICKSVNVKVVIIKDLQNINWVSNFIERGNCQLLSNNITIVYGWKWSFLIHPFFLFSSGF